MYSLEAVLKSSDLPYICAEVHGPQLPGALVCDTFANDEKIPGETVVVAMLDVRRNVCDNTTACELDDQNGKRDSPAFTTDIRVTARKISVGFKKCHQHSDDKGAAYGKDSFISATCSQRCRVHNCPCDWLCNLFSMAWAHEANAFLGILQSALRSLWCSLNCGPRTCREHTLIGGNGSLLSFRVLFAMTFSSNLPVLLIAVLVRPLVEA
jgi:hypothetical protein